MRAAIIVLLSLLAGLALPQPIAEIPVQPTAVLEPPYPVGSAAAIDPLERFFLTDKQEIRAYQTGTGRLLARQGPLPSQAQRLVSPDGRCVVVLQITGRLTAYETEQWSKVAEIALETFNMDDSAATRPIFDHTAFSSDGSYLAVHSASRLYLISTWNWTVVERVQVAASRRLILTPNFDRIAEYRPTTGFIEVIDRATGSRRLLHNELHTTGTPFCSILSDEVTAMGIAAGVRQIRTWNVSDGQMESSYRLDSFPHRALMAPELDAFIVQDAQNGPWRLAERTTINTIQNLPQLDGLSPGQNGLYLRGKALFFKVEPSGRQRIYALTIADLSVRDIGLTVPNERIGLIAPGEADEWLGSIMDVSRGDTGLAVWSRDGQLARYRAVDSTAYWRWKPGGLNAILGIANGEWLVELSPDSLQEIRRQRTHQLFAWNTDKLLLAQRESNDLVAIRRMPDLRLLNKIALPSIDLSASRLLLSEDRVLLAWPARWDTDLSRFQLWGPYGLVREIQTPRGARSWFAVSQNGKRLAVAYLASRTGIQSGYDPRIDLYDIETGSLVWRSALDRPAEGLLFSADGRWLVTRNRSTTNSGDVSHTLLYVRANDGAPIARASLQPSYLFDDFLDIDTGTGAVTSSVFSQSGKFMTRSFAGDVWIFPVLFPPGDANMDGQADSEDLALILENFGTRNAKHDLNGDGLVDDSDLALVLQNLG